MAKFFLRTNQTSGTAVLYTRVARKSYGINWWVNSKIVVDVEAWNKAQKNASALARYFGTEQGKKVQKQMELVSGVISDLFSRGDLTDNNDKHLLDQAIDDVINVDAIEAQEKVKFRKRQEEERQRCVIWKYYDYFVKGIEQGAILKKKGEPYKSGSVEVWKSFGRFLKGYTPQNMTFNEITKRFADGFVIYLQNLGLMPVTVNKYIHTFRALCNAAAVDEVNTNLISVKVWSERSVKDNEKRAEIALSDDEINALYDMPLNGIREQVRDVWCLGFFSGQRVSDYAHFSRDNFKLTKNRVMMIVLQQQKTGNDVVVPVIDDRVNELCAKYDYNFPKVNKRQINRYLKPILRDLSESVPSLQEWVRTPLAVREQALENRYLEMKERVKGGTILHGEERKVYNELKAYADEYGSDKLYKRDFSGAVIRQRWELVSSHTARRSAVTSLYDTGLFDTRELMSISGHKSERVFENYIKRGAIKQAERIAEKARKAKEIKLRKEA